ncbi:MAG TPA: chemotaxis protein CheX [Selenomonadales bacterium]|nr:chemotaxis protein CheX [Selenomonadales bacterium]
MDVRYVNPFIAAASSVVPQLGFKNIARGKVYTKDQILESLGVTVQVGMASNVNGNVVFNMTEDAAKRLSSAMMMGMPVERFDEVAQSAICELANMITSTAATALNQNGIQLRVAPPRLVQGVPAVQICNSSFIGIEMIIDELPIEIGIGLNE